MMNRIRKKQNFSIIFNYLIENCIKLIYLNYIKTNELKCDQKKFINIIEKVKIEYNQKKIDLSKFHSLKKIN